MKLNSNLSMKSPTNQLLESLIQLKLLHWEETFQEAMKKLLYQYLSISKERFTGGLLGSYLVYVFQTIWISTKHAL